MTIHSDLKGLALAFEVVEHFLKQLEAKWETLEGLCFADTKLIRGLRIEGQWLYDVDGMRLAKLEGDCYACQTTVDNSIIGDLYYPTDEAGEFVYIPFELIDILGESDDG